MCFFMGFQAFSHDFAASTSRLGAEKLAGAPVDRLADRLPDPRGPGGGDHGARGKLGGLLGAAGAPCEGGSQPISIDFHRF